MVTERVLCELGTLLLDRVEVNFGRLLKSTHGSGDFKPFIADDRVGFRAVPFQIDVGKGLFGRGFIRVLRFTPCRIFPLGLHTLLHIHVAVTRRTNV
jgi:hypothetical protein